MDQLIDVILPADQVEGSRSQVQRWLKAVGEAVTRDEPLVEIETDKVTVEVSSPGDGVLAEITEAAGADVAPGAVLGRLRPAGVAAVAGPTAAAPAQSPGAPQPDRAARARTGPSAAATADSGRLSPAVRRLLAERGLGAGDVQGSGEGGRITIEDVLASPARAAAAPESAPQPTATAALPAPGVRRIPHTPMRRRIAAHMVESLLHTAPHVTTVFQADLSALLAHRVKHKQELERRGVSLTLTAYFAAACVDAIRDVPEANARWTDDAILIHERIDLGIATALEGRGLVVPVVRDVGSLDLEGIARALGELVRRAREDRLTAQDLEGGTFTISNHGVSGSLLAAPIVIPERQSAILGVGKLEKRPLAVSESGKDVIAIRPCCYLTLTIDHRVLDGHQANRFMETLKARLERWPV